MGSLKRFTRDTAVKYRAGHTEYETTRQHSNACGPQMRKLDERLQLSEQCTVQVTQRCNTRSNIALITIADLRIMFVLSLARVNKWHRAVNERASCSVGPTSAWNVGSKAVILPSTLRNRPEHKRQAWSSPSLSGSTFNTKPSAARQPSLQEVQQNPPTFCLRA